jgi:type IV fimbrial biogenesis protein FimT
MQLPSTMPAHPSQPPLPPRRGARHRGFTLVELALALTIAALVAALGVPAFADWIASYQLANHARHLAETMTRARAEAVRRGLRVNLCKSPDQRRCDGTAGWERGFLVHEDANRDAQFGDGEALIASDGPAPPGVTVTANRPLDAYVSFTEHGHARLANGALQMGTLTVCRRGQLAREVVLSAGGRVRVDTTTERCP